MHSNKDVDMSKKTKTIEPLAFWPATLCLFAFFATGVISPEYLGKILDYLLYATGKYFGSIFLMILLAAFFYLIFIFFSKYGNVVIGGKNAKPNFTYWQWFSICVCSSIGAGLLFWGLGEPVYHLAAPPEALDIEPFSKDAAVFGITQTVFHWGIFQYVSYTITGIAIAVSAYDAKKFSLSNTFVGWLGEKKAYGPIGHIIDSIGIFACMGGLGCTAAIVIMQIGAGLNALFGIPETNITYLFIIGALMLFFITSCVVGLQRGLQRLSDFNTKLYFMILAYIFLVGPTFFILDMSTTVFGSYIGSFMERATLTNAMVSDNWATNWTVVYWGAYIAGAVFIGMFFARLARGRTLRQFIIVTTLAPSLFTFVWISVFGSVSMELQASGTVDIWAEIQKNGMQQTVYQILQNFPGGTIFMGGFLLAVIISFVTYADPISSVLSSLSSKTMNIEQEPSTPLKVFWGLSIGTIGYFLVISGGIQSIRGIFAIIGVPMVFVGVLQMYSTTISLRQRYEEQFPSEATSTESQ